MDREFARASNIPTIALQHVVTVEAVDGRELSSGAVTNCTVPLEVYVQETLCTISFSLISSPHAPIILGLPWLELLNPKIDWLSRSLIFPGTQSQSQVNFSSNQEKHSISSHTHDHGGSPPSLAHSCLSHAHVPCHASSPCSNIEMFSNPIINVKSSLPSQVNQPLNYSSSYTPNPPALLRVSRISL